jgi:hypothetical protein
MEINPDFSTLNLPFEVPAETNNIEALDAEIAPSIYDKSPSPQLMRAVDKVVGPELWPVLEFLALGAGVHPLTYLRQQVAWGVKSGDFSIDIQKEAIKPEQKRKKSDDSRDLSDENKFLKAMLREPSYGILQGFAKGHGLNNYAALQLGCENLFKAAEVRERLADSADAMKQYNQLKKKEIIFNALS